jgi:plasmid stabilization system protein ParE
MTSNTRLAYSRIALRNIAEILQYTFDTWGGDQEDAYRAVLEKACEQIRQFPEIGHPIEGRPSNIRVYTLPNHLIQYRSEPNRVLILRIISSRRRR